MNQSSETRHTLVIGYSAKSPLGKAIKEFTGPRPADWKEQLTAAAKAAGYDSVQFCIDDGTAPDFAAAVNV